ncbi:Vacuolar cation/proton exchanger 5 [Hibiscus syriacus]|uniref:Vacuolar cation/proton exchanger n=1 Tax=Hibiscus syriacus TaxID=106335 RepID=A0A6A3AK97_HIBSY|nr:Vacuolar cation/proton exchanger 5 [Hibiscus syriacus]
MDSGDNRYIHVVDDDTNDPEATESEAEQPRRVQAFSVILEEGGDRKPIGTVIYKSIYTVILSKKFNVLIPFGPLAILVQKKTNRDGWVFIIGLLGIMPLAERLGYTTEQLAFYSGPTVGGLLNATFGNATELIISIYALRTGRIRVVQLSLLGSLLSNLLFVLGIAFFSGGIVRKDQFFDKATAVVNSGLLLMAMILETGRIRVVQLSLLGSLLSNMLFVLGIAFFSGGIVRKDQFFDKATAVVNSGLLLMAMMGLLFPATLHSTGTEVHFGISELALSRVSSCALILVYAISIIFQLKNLNDMEGSQAAEIIDGDEDEEAGPEISKWESVIWLTITAAAISILSEYLVDAIEGTSLSWGVPVAFITVILLPIGGNTAAVTTSVMFALKDKLDVSLGVAIGSSTQISMFIIPFCVVTGWIFGFPVDLNFQPFETATLFMTVLFVAFITQEGTSNYFKGLMLLFCYFLVAASYFVHEDPSTWLIHLMQLSSCNNHFITAYLANS